MPGRALTFLQEIRDAITARLKAEAADADAYHRDVANRQNQHLQALGFKTAADAPLTLTIQFQPARDTGQKRLYREIGRLRQNIDVNVIEVSVAVALTDAGGAVVRWP